MNNIKHWDAEWHYISLEAKTNTKHLCSFHRYKGISVTELSRKWVSSKYPVTLVILI